MTDLDQVRRDDLEGVPAALATALDSWLFRTHGIASGGHNTGTFLDELAASGLAVVEQTAEVVYVAHQRLEDGTCRCGWAELGKSHFAHVDEAIKATARPAAGTTDLGSINITREADGTITAEHVGDPITCVSLGLLAQHDPAVMHVRAGRVCVGDLVYRVAGFEPGPAGAAAAVEGGMIVLELVRE